MGQFAISQSVARDEDPRFLVGRGEFIADKDLPYLSFGYFVRSPHAHARIMSTDLSRAKSMPGVLGVFSHADIAADHLGTTRCRMPRKRPDGSPMYQSPHPGLANGEVHFVGDPVVYVVAETLRQAQDAAEAVEVEYDILPSVSMGADAISPGAPPVWENCPDNISNVFELGDRQMVDNAFARAVHVVEQRFVISRVISNPIEPRGCIGEYDRRSGRYTLYGCIASTHSVRKILAEDVFRIAETNIRVVGADIGGTFGSKGNTSPENLVTLWASKRVGRPIKWIASRSEGFLSDEHGRDSIAETQLALDAEGHFLALRVKTICNLGAYLCTDTNLFPTFLNLGTLAGVYRTPAIHVTVLAVFTNTMSTAPYRGSGRPEACYIMEGLIDRAATETNIDRIELRRRNLIPPDAMPFKTGLVFTYDCGEFETILDKSLALANYQEFPERRKFARQNGKLRGIGIACFIERSGGPPGAETAQIRFDPTGTVTLLVGTTAQGQGHETMYKILLSHLLGVDTRDVLLVQGDTDKVQWGMGTWGSRSAVVGGAALFRAAEKVIGKGRKIAAHLLEAADEDIIFENGAFGIAGTDRKIPLKEVARASYQPGRLPATIDPGLFETGLFDPQAPAFPNGCHICEIEIDQDTGVIEIVGYVAVDDVGTILNHLTLEGQIHGGIAQGIGQALFERITYDPHSGQLVSGSFMDYAMPRASDFSKFELENHPVPTTQNPLGLKGAGEAGTVGALAATMNAVRDALSVLGVAHIDMPLSPDKIWKAIKSAEAGLTA